MGRRTRKRRVWVSVEMAELGDETGRKGAMPVALLRISQSHISEQREDEEKRCLPLSRNWLYFSILKHS
jgi:hypothetical protein